MRVASEWAAYTSSTSSRVMVAESCTSTPGRQWSSTTSGTSELAHTTTSAFASRAAPRNVMRSGAPGPAPTKEITAAPALLEDDGCVGVVEVGADVLAVEGRAHHEALPLVGHDRAGPGRQRLEGHDPRH